MSYVPPSGDPSSPYVVCGEAPGAEEVRMGRGFVGPSGKMLWPVMRRLAGVERDECWVTNLCKHPLDDEADAKLSPEEFEECRASLFEELGSLTDPMDKRILAVGSLAARALLPFEYRRMEVHNGMTYTTPEGWKVTPCYHPAAALRGAGDGKDPLAWMGDALAHWGNQPPRYPLTTTVPAWRLGTVDTPTSKGLQLPDYDVSVIAVDTEGTLDDPICLTWADRYHRYYVPRDRVEWWWDAMVKNCPGVMVVYHNAPWDWTVMEAMGIKAPWKVPFEDTMEKAYVRQTEPQGLKDLAFRHFGIPMRTWEEVVLPYYDETVLSYAAGVVEAGTTYETHTSKGKVRKKPIVHRTDEAKSLARLLPTEKKAGNAALLRTRMGYDDPPSLRYVPFNEVAEYATLDPWMTLKVWEVFQW